MKDFTKGNIPKQLLELALPLIIGNILQQLYNVIDALVVGRYIGTDAFAALGVAGTIMNLFVFVLVGSCTGVGIIFAQFYGEGNLPALRREGFIAQITGTCFTLALSLLGILCLNPLLGLIATPDEIIPLLKEYLYIIFGGLSMTFFYNYYSTLLRSVGSTAMALGFLALSMLINLLLDVLLVAYWHWGIQGAAWATICAQAFAAGCCYFYLRGYLPQLLWTRQDIAFDKALLWRTCNYGLVTAAHNSNLYIGKLLVQGAINDCGVGMVAAYTATGRLEGFINSFGDSGTAALNVFIAQNCGAGKTKRVQEGFLWGLRLLLSFSILCSCLLYFGAEAGMSFMLGTNTGASFFEGVSYLHIISCCYFLCLTGNALAGYFEGRGLLMLPTIGATGHITIRCILSYIWVKQYGLSAVALATGVGWLAVVCFWSYWAYKVYSRQ